MSSLDDARKLLQDIVSPDIKALAAKIESGEALNKQRYDALNQRFTDAEKLNTARYETLLQAIQNVGATADARIDSLEKNLGLAQRMELLEAKFNMSKSAVHEERTFAAALPVAAQKERHP